MNKVILIITLLLFVQTAFAAETKCRDLIYPGCECSSTRQQSVFGSEQVKVIEQLECCTIIDQPDFGTVSCHTALANVDGTLYYYIPDSPAVQEDAFTVECCISGSCDTTTYMLHMVSSCELKTDYFCCVPNDGSPFGAKVLCDDWDYLMQNYPNYTIVQAPTILGITAPPVYGTANIIQSYIHYSLMNPIFIGIDSMSYDIYYELVSPFTSDTLSFCNEQTAYFNIEDCNLETNIDELTIPTDTILCFSPLDNDSITGINQCSGSPDCQSPPIPQINTSSFTLFNGDSQITQYPNQMLCFSSSQGGTYTYTYGVCTTDNLCSTNSISIHVTENCEDTLNIVGHISGGTYHAGTLLASTGTVADNTYVDFKAGVTVAMGMGFSVPIGSSFSAEIEDCDCDVLRDSLALVALYNATDGASWTNTWDLAQPMNTWYGVDVDENGCVTCLNLDGDGVGACSLAIGIDGNNLIGTIPLEIGDLSKLEILDLRRNQLSGNIPTSIGNLTNLTHLYLSYNELSGHIPVSTGNLTSLTHLSLAVNELDGPIPSELGNLTSLLRLYLNVNELRGSIPIELSYLSNLVELSLSNNQLSGPIPHEFGVLSNLRFLLLAKNQLNGSIPPDLGSLGNLTHLHLHDNTLSGNMPPELSNLSNLAVLYLRDNQLNGCYDTALSSLCSQLNPGSSTNSSISNGNSFDADWESFCSSGAGTCP